MLEVYRELGCGFLESVYHECLEVEFGLRRIPFDSKRELTLTYKGQALEQVYVPDFICFDRIILEIKAVSDLTDVFRAKVHNYLKAIGMRLGRLVNFGHHPLTEHERIIR